MFWFFKQPTHHKHWLKKHGEQSSVKLENGTADIARVRNFVHGENGVIREEWIPDVRIQADSIVGVWFILEPFSIIEAVAHPYLVFQMNDGSCICFSIEGKRQEGEAYSGIHGSLNGYELGYVWLTLHDCLSMPLSVGCKALYAYKLEIEPGLIQKLFSELIIGTEALFQKPRFYNTLFHNCTTILAHLLQKLGLPLSWDISWHLPGYFDRYLMRVGIIKTSLPYYAMRAACNLKAKGTEILGATNTTPQEFGKLFSSRWAIQDSNL